MELAGAGQQVGPRRVVEQLVGEDQRDRLPLVAQAFEGGQPPGRRALGQDRVVLAVAAAELDLGAGKRIGVTIDSQQHGVSHGMDGIDGRRPRSTSRR